MKFTKLGKLTHVNLRAEGKDDKELAVDIKLQAVVDSDDLIEIHPNLVSMLWNADRNPRFGTLIDSVQLKCQLLHHELKIQTVLVRDAKLHKLNVTPLPLGAATLEFTATCHPGSQTVAALTMYLAEEVELSVSPLDDLFSKPAGAPQTVLLSNGETVTVTMLEDGPPTVTTDSAMPTETSRKPARQKRPGGNRRKAVPKDEAASGPVAEKTEPAVGAWPFPKRPD